MQQQNKTFVLFTNKSKTKNMHCLSGIQNPTKIDRNIKKHEKHIKKVFFLAGQKMQV
jgi:hypothetical protein